jgi:hypothetical protein
MSRIAGDISTVAWSSASRADNFCRRQRLAPAADHARAAERDHRSVVHAALHQQPSETIEA